MGFDNECILNIQSLAGEYFCPVCRTLVYPHEAIQTQCTHLYCKPCLSYVVSSTQACPYDGYLVTEAGSKPLVESNKALADTIGKTVVHCLYHRSGCVWQGSLSESTTHCSACSFGNSPVVCNRCGIQIVHRQVQEHAQTCNVNGTNTQPQGSDQSKVANQAVAPLPQTAHAAVGPAAQNLSQPATSNPFPQAMAPPEQQYYQQYYQQYPGYDPYQQAYQQYYPYQQLPAQQIQPQPQVQQPQVQNQPQTHPQAQANGPPQPLYPQAAVAGSSQHQGQVSSQPQGHMPVQPYSQVQPHLVQSHAQPPQYQQPGPQPPQVQPYPQTQPQPPTQFHPQPQSINFQHPPPGHPPHAPPQQHPMQVQPPSGSLPPQFPPPPPPPHMRPPHMLPPQQRPISHQVQQPIPSQYPPQPQAFPGQMSGQFQGQPRHAAPFPHQQVRPQVPPQPMQQPSPGFAQPPQGNVLPHGMPPYVAGPAMLNQGGPPARPPQFGSSQYEPPSGGDQTLERRVEQQEDKSPSLKKSEPVISDFGAKFNEVKHEAGVKEEFKREDGNRKDETLIKDDSVSTLRVKEENKDGAFEDNSAKQGDISVNFDNGPFNQSQTTPQGQIGQQSTRPPGHGYLPHGPHPGDQFQPPGPTQPRPFHPEANPSGSEPHGHHGPSESHYDTRRQDSHLPGNLDRGPYRPPYGDEKFRTSNNFHMPPHLSRPSKFYEKDSHNYGYDAGPRLPPHHHNESRFEHNRPNPDFLGPMRGYGQHHMDRLPPTSPRSFFDGRNMERQPYGERFPMGPPGHMHRGEFDGPRKPMNGEFFGPREPGFGPFHDYGRSGEPYGGPMSTRPRLDEPFFRNSYSRQGFYSGGPDSFDPSMKRKTFSVGWCRICKVECESVEGLEMHGQTREHQRMSMDMVISIKKNNIKRQRTSIDGEETGKFRNPEIYARPDKS